MKKYIKVLALSSVFCFVHLGAMKKDMPKNTTLSSAQVAELRKAVIDYKKDRQKNKASAKIAMYAKNYPNDAFVKAKLNEKSRFDGNIEKPAPRSALDWEKANKAMEEHYAAYNRGDRSEAKAGNVIPERIRNYKDERAKHKAFYDAMDEQAKAYDEAMRGHYGAYDR